MSLKDALTLVRSVRPIAEPNPGFIEQLKSYELQKLGSVSDDVNTLLTEKLIQMKEIVS